MKKENGFYPPMIVETTDRGVQHYDIYSRLMKDRIVFVTEVNDDSANCIIAQLFFLDNEDQKKPIYMYINSPGGVITAGLAIYDVMQAIRPPINTICIGMAASMGAVLLAGGDAGRRATLPNSTHMIHQASGGARGQTKDVKIEAAEQERLENRLIDILAKHTKKPAEQIRIDIDRDNYMDSQKALEYGLVDRIITKIGEKK